MRVLPCIHNPVALWAAYCIARHKRAKCGALHMARVITLANFEGVPLYPVYTIQPVVKPVINRSYTIQPVVKPVQPVECLYT